MEPILINFVLHAKKDPVTSPSFVEISFKYVIFGRSFFGQAFLGCFGERKKTSVIEFLGMLLELRQSLILDGSQWILQKCLEVPSASLAEGPLVSRVAPAAPAVRAGRGRRVDVPLHRRARLPGAEGDLRRAATNRAPLPYSF